MRASYVLRIRIIAGAFTVLSLIVIGKLYYLQVVLGDAYREKALDQPVVPSVHQMSRGTIYFTDKDGSKISAATLQSGFTVAVLPPLIKDAPSAYTTLSRVAPQVEKGAFMEAVAKKSDPYEEVARRLPEEVGLAVLDTAIPGVRAYREQWRFYPGKTLAAHEIGFLGFDKDGVTVKGQYGLERAYNDVLSRPGSGLKINFFAELFSSFNAFSTQETPTGGDVITSIEPTVQAYLEDALATYNKDWNAASVGGIIMDPKTGAIIAMASLPTYNPNDIKEADPLTLSNPLVESVREFGSTMKPITMAAALDSGAVDIDSTYNDTGTLTIDQKTISNFDGKARGIVPMQEILSQSLNIGIAHIVQKMGTGTMREYMRLFGVTEETGIDLPSEASPLVSNLESPRAVEFITAGYGQGVAITPIAMTRALATLANKGAVPQPHVGLYVEYPDGTKKELGWSPPRQAIRPETAEKVTNMLVKVVDTALRHGDKKIPELSVAAKTGTAQIANPAGGGYYKDRYLHSFFGYFPAHDARFLVFLYAVEPKGAQYASETLTDPFFSITKFLMTYYSITPDRTTP